eukprot:9080510-Alexandrium_andersonii.AAC.1
MQESASVDTNRQHGNTDSCQNVFPGGLRLPDTSKKRHRHARRPTSLPDSASARNMPQNALLRNFEGQV